MAFDFVQELGQAIRENIWSNGVDVRLECVSKSTLAILGSFLRIR